MNCNLNAQMAFRINARNPLKVFAIKVGRGEGLYTVVSLKGTRGAPRKDEKNTDHGYRTFVTLKNVNTGKIRTMTLLEAVTRGARYRGFVGNLYAE